MKVDGVKIRDIEGTDLALLRDFCKEHKINWAVIVYGDDEGLNSVSYHKDTEGKRAVSKFVKSLR